MTDPIPSQRLPAGLKLALDFGPLLIFFAANKLAGVYVATAAFMAATAIAIGIAWLKTRHIPPMLIFTGVIVAVFGGLTLWLQDDSFIKIKPSLIYGSFAAILGFGLATGRNYLRLVLGEVLPALNDIGWVKLQRNWALFFAAMVVVNEVLRRVLTTDQWVDFKVWGVTAATMIFAVAQAPLLKRHGVSFD